MEKTNKNMEAEVAPEVEASTTENTTPEPPKKPRGVKVFLNLDEEHKEPVFVGVNGIGYLVERGKQVEVPKAVAEVLKNAEEQRMNSIRYMDEHAE